METKHTPGPWHASRDALGSSNDWMIGRPDGKPDEVAVCSERDATLIAAAPELLAALRRANIALCGYLPSHRNAVTDAAIAAATAAIAKAVRGDG